MHIHILGICGTFMGGVAALAREAGHKVTGCDAGVYPPMSDQLRALGIDLIEGFGADQLALKPDIWVVGNVVSRARLADGTPSYPLMEAILDAGAALHQRPAVAGRARAAGPPRAGRRRHPRQDHHHVDAGLGPRARRPGSPASWSAACRANFGISARLGQDGAAAFVIEADEYDTAFFDKRSKFVHYRPRTAMLNNLEFDHADIFDDLAAIERQFHHLVRTVPATGRVVVNGLEESLARVLHMGCWSELRSFGARSATSARRASPHSFDVLERGAPRRRGVEWDLSGVHNQINALAAIAAAEHVGVAPGAAARALREFRNVKRRMEVRGTVERASRSTTISPITPPRSAPRVDGLRRKVGAGKTTILAVFEPRSNTMKLGTMKAQLPWSLEQADLSFCHSGGLDWNAAEALAPMGEKAQVAGNIEELVRAGVAAAAAGRPHPVHEQRRLWRCARQAAAGAGAASGELSARWACARAGPARSGRRTWPQSPSTGRPRVQAGPGRGRDRGCVVQATQVVREMLAPRSRCADAGIECSWLHGQLAQQHSCESLQPPQGTRGTWR